MTTHLQYIRQALRALRSVPGFSGLSIVTLALGMGAVTAIFAVIYAVVLRPLPYPEAERLVSLDHPLPGRNADWQWDMSSGGFFFFTENSRSLEALGVYDVARLSLAGGGVAQNVQVANTSASLFDVLRARPAVGRLLIPEDNRTAAAVAVLGHGLWTTRFGGDPGVVGTTLEIEGRPIQVVGVTEPGVDLPDQDIALWIPARLSPAMYHANYHHLTAIGRLADGATLEGARTELAGLTERLPEAVPTAYSDSWLEETGFSTEVVPLREEIVGGIDGVLSMILGAVGVVLLIACANVANLFLVRMESRRKEVAIRSALGASPGQIARRYMTETVLVALFAGALGLVFASGGVELLLAFRPPDIPRLDGVGIGGPAVGFTALVSLVTGLVLGLIPVTRTRAEYGALREESRGLTASRGRHRIRSVLVIGQLALAIVLLSAAGLLIRTFDNLRSVETGLEPDGVLTADVSLPMFSYRGYEPVAAFYRELATRIEGLPGVRGIGAAADLPFRDYGSGCSIVFPRDRQPSDGYPCVSTARVAPGYFEALGIAVEGRASGWADNFNGTAGAVVSRAFAENVWPGENPIGKEITANTTNQGYFRVAGVAADVRAAGVDRPPVEAVYFPMIPARGVDNFWGPTPSMTLLIETDAAEPQGLGTALRRIVREIDPGVPVGDIRTMRQVMASHDSVARVSFTLTMLGIAAAAALLLSAIGLYGVIAYVVGQRTGEIGIRMALGAGSDRVARMVVRQSLALVGGGVILGLMGAIGVTRLLESLLFNVSPTDPLTLALVLLVLVGVAVAAAYLPARRASRVDPMVALRHE